MGWRGNGVPIYNIEIVGIITLFAMKFINREI